MKLIQRIQKKCLNTGSLLLLQNLIDEGYAATQILHQLHDVIIEESLSDQRKSVIAEKMAVGIAEPIPKRVHLLYAAN